MSEREREQRKADFNEAAADIHGEMERLNDAILDAVARGAPESLAKTWGGFMHSLARWFELARQMTAEKEEGG